MLFVTELFFFSAAICFLHSQRQRLGLASLYIVLGLFEAFLFFISRGGTWVEVELLFSQKVSFAYSLILPIMIGTVLIIYIFDGTREARRLIIAFVVLYIFHGALDILIGYHAANPPPGSPYTGDSPIVEYEIMKRVASGCSFFADAIVIVIAFQGLTNRFPKIGNAIPLYVCFVIAMLVDGFVYPLVYSGTLMGPGLESVIGKGIVGFIAGAPIAAYLQLSWTKDKALRESGARRGAFDIIDVRYKVREAERRFREQRQQYLMVKENFSRYVPPEIVEALIREPDRFKLGGDLLNVTVLFADIRGYSTLSEQLPPTDTIKLLNRYFEHVTKVIFEHGGMVNEYEGDGILAVFGAPLPIDRHAERGLRAAIGMFHAVERLNDLCERDGTADIWKQVGWGGFSIRVGLHSGAVVAGNIGTKQRVKYAVIGDTVNTTSRIEGLNKELGTDLLLSQAVVDELETPDAFTLVDLGEHLVRGRGKPVHVYTASEDARQRAFSVLVTPSVIDPKNLG